MDARYAVGRLKDLSRERREEADDLYRKQGERGYAVAASSAATFLDELALAIERRVDRRDPVIAELLDEVKG